MCLWLQLCSEVLELGERRAGLTNVLASALCASWRGEWERGGEERVVQSLLRHRQLILELCCFGGVGIRSMRSQENGEEFVRLLGDQVAANSAANRLADSVLEIHVFATPTVYPVASMETAECG
jgi:hypothetical protein